MCRISLARIGQSALGVAGGSGTVLLSSLLFRQQNDPSKQFTTPTNANAASNWRTIEYSPPIPVPFAAPNPSSSQETPVKLSRKVVSEVDKTSLGLRLYQYQTCPYCCKVRAFLDYFGFSYEVVEVNPVTRSQIKFSKTYKKVPILRTTCCDKPMIESSLIVSMLATLLLQPELSITDIAPMYPEQSKSGGGKREIVEHLNKYFVMWGEIKLSGEQIQDAREEREWREWVDSTFIHLISPNVYRTFGEALKTFKWFEQVGDWQQNFPMWERWMAVYVGASAMWLISKRLKKRHKITDEREAMRNAFKKFLEAKGPDRKFLGGDQPNLADLALYGACNSFYGCATFIEMRQQISELGDWFDGVDSAVKEGRGKHVIEANFTNEDH